MKFIIAAMICCVALTVASAQGVRPSVSVVGEAQMKIAPDQVVFTFEVVTIEKDLTSARKENDARSARTLATAKSFKISNDDIQTDSLTVSPKYTGQKDPRGTNVLVGYEVSKRILITLKDIGQIDAFVGKVIDAGVNRVVSISIENSQIQKFQEQVRAMAVKNARDKAQLYASQLGQTVGRAYVIREEDADSPAYDTGSGSGSGIGNGVGSGDSEIAVAKPFAFDQTVTFALGQIDISEKVYVTFELK